ncbi:type I polyketide synthase [Amycolatopsis anabasis]|uniref:type I polyketide synthase n=1 Tax=Amycolatopsis anabasis TaxID=1840409 RepID=UPI00131C6349|nr:type I polyketide synthase [Amycolatopsis anabasis]
MNGERIAIVGIGLRYPDAEDPHQLWENVLAGRRAFRRLPDERMNRADYWSPDPDAPDRFYAEKAAVLRDFEFDRVKYRVAGSTYRSTDLTHWLALEVAGVALADAGFPDGAGLPKQATGVVLGNTLTGEFARANQMRLRWPYVRRTVAAALADAGWTQQQAGVFLGGLEKRYKSPFPPIDEDSLAGGLANTIAGRICNHFDLGGGGYTVDGACSSSLLSVITAAKALADGDSDVVLAGGVDLSIDPFEVIGFAKTGALAPRDMKVYDRDSSGFWPGEGAGVLVLMRERDALARGARIYASITGWGVSSDGKGAITRPEASGHRLALARAYDRAGYGVHTVSYFEGHGTGTAVGDATEIEALSAARLAADPAAPPAALGTIKGNFGHTKAAAGVAGLVKAALAVYNQVIPPATGHENPHSKLLGEKPALYVPGTARQWPVGLPLRAGVSAMGFGGINTHVAIEQAPDAERRHGLDQRTRTLVTTRQDAELLLLDASTRDGLRERVTALANLVPKLAFAELADLAGTLEHELDDRPFRAAVVATSPEDAGNKLTRLGALLDDARGPVVSASEGIFADHRTSGARIVYLFPGQGSGDGRTGALRRRFFAADEIFQTAALPAGADQTATEVAQPRIVTASLAALRVLGDLGIEAEIAVGHSLGELTALHWGGAMGEAALLRLAGVRGEVMARASEGGGAMAGLAATPERVERFAAGEEVVIAGYNGPEQTVVSGSADAVQRVCDRARAEGVTATALNVSHAFHSPKVEPAALAMTERLADFEFARLSRPVVSTVTGDVLDPATDVPALLRDQILRPVRFHEAAAKAVAAADLVLEVGPGRVLTGLLESIAPDRPVLPVDTGSPSLAGLLRAVGAAFALGVPVRTSALFDGRVVRRLPLDREPVFLTSPCEMAPVLDTGRTAEAPAETVRDGSASTSAAEECTSTLDLLRGLAADRVELPVEMISADTHPLDDLHLSSITVGQLVNEVARQRGRTLEATPNFATVRLGELAGMIDQLAETGRASDAEPGEVPGVAPWVRAFSLEHVETARQSGRPPQPGDGDWVVYAPGTHPLAEPLRAALADAGVGNGVLLCLPPDGADHVALMLAAGQAVLARADEPRFVVVQQRAGAAGLARTLHLEHPEVPTTVVTLTDVEPTAVRATVAEVVGDVAATTTFLETCYDEAGTRTVPELCPVPLPSARAAETPLTAQDVLLVTGGGKGITAECALAIATDSGARLVLVGRADPAEDDELAANLSRMDAAGVRFRYERADVTDPGQVRAAVDQARSEFGAVTAILHGAGRNEPRALADLTEEGFRQALAPKIDGLRAVLAAVDPSRIKLLVTFGSIIGRAGLRGEAHYATANDRLSELALRFGREHPGTRVLALEWSVWSGAGMGERLGVVEALLREGITPISVDDGIAVLRRVLADPSAGPVLVITGRTGGLPTMTMRRRDLPLTRFCDRVLVHYPDTELITEADLSTGSDPYLNDHVFDDALLFPAVLGMEAITQVASALTGRQGPPLLDGIEFLRPVVVRPGATTTIRLAALVRADETVEVVLRSAETGFSADHFRARVRFPRPELPAVATPPVAEAPAVPLDPVTELYGEVLFQGKRFQRVLAYRAICARRAVAEISTSGPASWFAAFLPQELSLADPGTRDAMMHAIQCCVPDATLLPQRVERLYLARRADQDTGHVVLDAREVGQDGDSYTYDIDVRTPSGIPVERWEKVTLRAVRGRSAEAAWAPALLGPHLERALEEVLGGTRQVVVEPDPKTGPAGPEPDRRAQTELAATRALNRPARLRYRPDGRPETPGAVVSAAHGAELTLVVAGSGKLSCDVETVVRRSDSDWAGLLGPAELAIRELLAAESGEEPSVANTRTWCAIECLRKAGGTAQALTVERVGKDGWAVFSAGPARIATWVTSVLDRPDPIVFAVLAEAG